MSRSAEMLPYEHKEIELPARLYNLWRRFRLHCSLPIRFSLNGYTKLVMIIDQHEWLCADEGQYDLPIICWFGFQGKNRNAIHLPVRCKRNYYHFAAYKISESVLNLMEYELEKRLKQCQSNNFIGRVK